MAYYEVMKSLIFITIFVTVVAWLLWPEPEPLLPTAGNSVVVFGDSLAAGVGTTAGNDIASLLSAALGRTVINLGIPGDTTADGLERVKEVLATDPRVVIVLLGGNDALQKVAVETTFANLAEIITRIQATGAAVVLVGEPGGLYGSQYPKEYERLAKDYRTFYVPNILSGLLGRSEYMDDLIHPNTAGYQIAAERIRPVVDEALSES